MTSLPRIRMVLFFTNMIELYHWHSIGTLRRETAIYRKLEEFNVHTTYVTYGSRRDFKIARNSYQLSVRPNYLHLSPKRYRHWLHLLHAPTLMRADIIKTNQIPGADIAAKAAKFWNKPLIVRFGYLHSLFTYEMHGKDSKEAKSAYDLETDVFHKATAIVGTTNQMKMEVENRSSQLPVRVIPNYVETDHFKPLDTPKKIDITFVGRLHEQKNLQSLLEAIASMDVTCRIIGQGALREQFDKQFGDLNRRLTYYGQVDHNDLPRLLNESRLFIMPSYYEGHPKAVIEAMSCGLPVIATNVNGNREVIEHGVSGWLCGTSAESIQAAINTVLNDTELKEKLGKNARDTVVREYSLDNIAKLEYEMIREVVVTSKHNKANG